jgi:hypothetical protein
MKKERHDKGEDFLKVFARETLDWRYSTIKDAIQECLGLLDEADKELSRGTGDGLQHLKKVEGHALIGTEHIDWRIETHGIDAIWYQTDIFLRTAQIVVFRAQEHATQGEAIQAKTEVSSAQRILVKASEMCDKEYNKNLKK